MLRSLVIFALLAADAALAGDAPPVPYPDGYRQWTHVKSMVILQGHPLYEAFGGIHHLYANANALQGYKTGHFADGAVIVFDLLEATAKDNAIAEGTRKVIGVMRKDSRRYAATGGWGFEAFKGDSSTERAVASNAKAACFDCHASQKDRGFVFSRWRR